MLVPMMLWEIATGPALPQTATAWLAVLAVALIPSVGAYSGYQYGVRRFGPTTMAMSSYLWTPYGLLLSIIFLGETLHAYHFVGLALILPGVVLATARFPCGGRSSFPCSLGLLRSPKRRLVGQFSPFLQGVRIVERLVRQAPVRHRDLSRHRGRR